LWSSDSGVSGRFPAFCSGLDNVNPTDIRCGATMTPRKRYSFWINDVQAAGLKAVKQAEDVTESEQIRQALNDWLKKKGVMKSERKRAATRRRA
jgi:hypothetical protein